MKLHKELLHKSHNRKDFDCGIDSLNHYIHIQAGQDFKKKLSVCFVFNDRKTVKGYYTLSSGSIPLADVPMKYAKKYPKSYNNIPVILLGRLAIDKSCQGKGYGAHLLVDALKESYDVSKTKIGAVAVIVEPVNLEAENFYGKYGFMKLDTSGKMFLPMNTIQKLFEKTKK